MKIFFDSSSTFDYYQLLADQGHIAPLSVVQVSEYLKVQTMRDDRGSTPKGLISISPGMSALADYPGTTANPVFLH
jgi:hypothetical protein